MDDIKINSLAVHAVMRPCMIAAMTKAGLRDTVPMSV
jgi:hypothetical protein